MAISTHQSGLIAVATGPPWDRSIWMLGASLLVFPNREWALAPYFLVGAGYANFGLSERRAKTVRDYLIRFGVDEERLTLKSLRNTRGGSDYRCGANKRAVVQDCAHYGFESPSAIPIIDIDGSNWLITRFHCEIPAVSTKITS